MLDDVKLGKLIKHSGLKQDALDAGGGLSVQWQDSFFGVIRGLEKNGFAIFEYSLVKLVGYSLVVVLFNLFPYAAVLLWPDLRGSGWLASVLFLHAATAVTARMLGSSAIVSLGLPVAILAYPLYDVAVGLLDADATRRTLARHVLPAERAPRKRLLTFGREQS